MITTENAIAFASEALFRISDDYIDRGNNRYFTVKKGGVSITVTQMYKGSKTWQVANIKGTRAQMIVESMSIINKTLGLSWGEK